MSGITVKVPLPARGTQERMGITYLDLQNRRAHLDIITAAATTAKALQAGSACQPGAAAATAEATKRRHYDADSTCPDSGQPRMGG